MTQYPIKLSATNPVFIDVSSDQQEFATPVDFASHIASNVVYDASTSIYDMMEILQNIMFECIGRMNGDLDTDRQIVQVILRGLHGRLVEFREQQKTGTFN